MAEMVDVYLSPSLQEWNVGVGNYGTEEQRMNLLADVVQYELERHGLNVARNRPEMSLAEVVRESNAIGPTVHVALHSNAANGQARGAEIYAHRFGGAGEALARDIFEFLEPLTPTSDLGVKEGYKTFNGQGMYELRRTVAPAVLAEVAFHDNPDDARFIIDNIYEIGQAISQGILQNFGINYVPDTPENVALLQNRYNGVLF